MIAVLLGGIAKGQWVEYNNSFLNNKTVSVFAINGYLFVGTNQGIYRSADNVANWVLCNTSIPHQYYSFAYLFTNIGTNIFTASSDSVYISTNNGASWTTLNIGMLLGFSIHTISAFGTTIFAGTDGGIFRSTNYGTSWTELTNAVTTAGNSNVHSFAASGTTIFAGMSFSRVIKSDNNGASWTGTSAGPYGSYEEYLAVCGTNIFASAVDGYNGGLYKSSNNGTSWSLVNTGIPGYSVYSIAAFGTNIFAGTIYNGLYLSSDNGVSWDSVSTGLPNGRINSFAISGNNIFVSVEGRGVWKRPLSEMVGISENENINNFTLSPNPATNTLTLNLSQQQGLQNATVSIYDIQGKQLLTQNISQTQTQIDISSFAKGIYIVKLQTEKETLQSKFVKE